MEWNMKVRKIVGILIICIGVGICSYPMIKQAYSSHRQAELKEAFEELLEQNQSMSPTKDTSPTEIQVPSVTASPETTVVSGDSITIMDGTDSEYIDLEENNVVSDSQTADNIKDRLKGQTVIGLIEIEKIDLIYAIVEGTSDSNLGVAIGHMRNTAAIGNEGNCALAGHRGGTSGPYFKNIHKLSSGDKIKITDIYGNEYTYAVTESFVVEPNDMSVIKDISEQKILTLITCQDSGTKRLIVRAVCK